MSEPDGRSVHERWAHLRFSVVGQLLADPPPKGLLRAELKQLAARTWRHPVTGEPVRFGRSTLERWYYRSLRERRDPVGVLRRKVRKDLGTQQSVSRALRTAVVEQYADHPHWSVQLHYLNLRVLTEQRPDLGPLPCYSTIRRFFKAHGLHKRRRVSSRRTAGAERAETRLLEREVRSYEAEYVGGLWHWDAHVSSRKVLTARGEWVTPILFGVLDDRSRLICHLQWYLGPENAQIVAHGLAQAFMKRGLPRAGLSDNGAAMIAAEITEALARLGVLNARTLPYSAYMNAKIEVFWASVEGQLMSMLENVPDLTLTALNEATLAWAEYGYNRSNHSETGQVPLSRFLAGPDVLRASPDSAALRLAFTKTERRTQRLSDGTVVIEAHRFEVPNCYRHLTHLQVRYASWDLIHVHLVDERTGQVLCRLFPQDKAYNARGVRRPLEPVAMRSGTAAAAFSNTAPLATAKPVPAVAPLLSKFLAQQAATGLPPPFLSIDQDPHSDPVPNDAGDDP
ncbi:MAG: integrase family protein [Gammaproteobacteria bacterium]|nr:integrase family protein [Gammaproteobacteria bacterium]